MGKRISWLLGIALALTFTARAGVMVEGASMGMEPVQKIGYQPDKNRFVINSGKFFRNPVSRGEMAEIVQALRLDDRLGIAANAQNETVVYGGMSQSGELAQKLKAADDLLRAVVFADAKRLQGLALPAKYVPQFAAKRDRESTIYFCLDNFVYQVVAGVYWLENMQADLVLIPLAKDLDAAGNYLPDYDAMEKGYYQPEDFRNAEHFTQNQKSYLEMPILADVVKIGQAAAFARHLRANGFDLELFARYLSGGSEFSLTAAETTSLVEGKAAAAPTLPTAPIKLASNAAQPSKPAPANPTASPPTAAPRAEELEQQNLFSYSESIKQILALDNQYGRQNAVKMNRQTVNDGSYVAFRTEYLKNIKQVNLSASPEEFQRAYAAHTAVWEKTLKWLAAQKIADQPEAFDQFKAAHAKYRDELSTTYAHCQEVAQKYAK